MSALRPFVLSRARQLAAPARQLWVQSAVQHGESSQHSKTEEHGEVIEQEKRKHLKGETVSTLKSQEGWSEKLASDGEAIVKAEKHHKDDTIEELQSHTVHTVKKMHGDHKSK